MEMAAQQVAKLNKGSLVLSLLKMKQFAVKYAVTALILAILNATTTTNKVEMDAAQTVPQNGAGCVKAINQTPAQTSVETVSSSKEINKATAMMAILRTETDVQKTALLNQGTIAREDPEVRVISVFPSVVTAS